MNKKSLNKTHLSIIHMKIKKITMNDNDTEFEVVWDTERIDDTFYNMLDIRKGWVHINKNSISHIVEKCELKDLKAMRPQIKEEVREYYGDFYPY